MIALTDKERRDYVSHRWFLCMKSIDNVKKGEGCKVGENYWFEYIHDGEKPLYRKLSDNNHYDEVYISDRELIENFEIV